MMTTTRSCLAVLAFVGLSLMFGNAPNTSNKAAAEVSKLWAGYLQKSNNRHAREECSGFMGA